MATLEEALRQTHDWAIDRIHYLSERDIDDARAIQCEFAEWFDPDIPDHDVISMQYSGD